MRVQLTALEVRKLAKVDGMHRAGPGLYLRVRGGSVLWMFRYMQSGKARELSIGAFPALSLADALAKAADLRAKIKRGEPLPVFNSQPRNRTAVPSEPAVESFRDVAEALCDAMRAGWKGEGGGKHGDDWINSLRTYAYPCFGDKPVAEVATDDVLAALSPIWSTKTETATRVRQRIEAVLSAAKARGLRSGENPAAWKGHLDALLPTISKRRRVEHHAAMNWRDVPAFMSELRQRSNMSAWALQLTILTACRTGEVIGARWAEIDLESGLWVIPAVRMKAHVEHRVPLPSQAVELLESMPRMEGSDAVFWGRSKKGEGGTISQWAMLMLIKGMRPGLTVHGFRSAFRDWAAENTSFPGEVVEMALAHTIANQVEAAYRRGDLLDKRRELMQAWADYLE
uniref:Integrase family protein n=1 Tax=Thiomonas intermedia (strain K12) TaxID=75379 RepID=D5X1C2_THIK1